MCRLHNSNLHNNVENFLCNSYKGFQLFFIMQVVQKSFNMLKTFVHFDGALTKESASSFCTKIHRNFLHSSFCTNFFQHFFPILCKMTIPCKSQDGKLHKTTAAFLFTLSIDNKSQPSFCTNFIPPI